MAEIAANIGTFDVWKLHPREGVANRHLVICFCVLNNDKADSDLAPSSRGLGHGPFKAATRVRIPSGSGFLWGTFPNVPCEARLETCPTSQTLEWRNRQTHRT